MLMAMCGLGVVLCVAHLAAGKGNPIPYAGLFVLVVWAILQTWHATSKTWSQATPSVTTAGDSGV